MSIILQQICFFFLKSRAITITRKKWKGFINITLHKRWVEKVCIFLIMYSSKTGKNYRILEVKIEAVIEQGKKKRGLEDAKLVRSPTPR